MMRNTSFRRKVIYLVSLIPLLAALALIGLPATGKRGDASYSAGGKLARLRTANDLSQANLGEIDPAGETMKLATLGLRPVAASILWDKANNYKRTESWDALSATLNQITKLEPNFITVWEFQAHNLSYNISVEFDDYRHRYHWVKKGIQFLLDGTQYNKNEPKLPWNLGWFIGQKIGRADEHEQFRRLFRDDHDFHDELGGHIVIGPESLGPDNKNPDNWKVARLWYLLSNELVNLQNSRKGDLEIWRKVRYQLGGQVTADQAKGRSPLIYLADPCMSLINYASTIQEEGRVGEVAQIAWQTAGQEWVAFGRQPIRSSWGHTLLLDSAEELSRDIAELRTALDALAVGERQKIHDERFASLSPEEHAALQAVAANVRPDNVDDYLRASEKMTYTDMDVVERAPKDSRFKAHKLATQIAEKEVLLDKVKRYRIVINFEYWKVRCEAEASDEAIRARRNLYEAQQLYDEAILADARQKYEAAWDDWGIVFERHPLLVESVTAQDLMVPIRRYRTLLEQLGEPFPKDFKLQMLIDLREKKSSPLPAAKPADTKEAGDTNEEGGTKPPGDAKEPPPSKEQPDPAKPPGDKPATPSAPSPEPAKPEPAKPENSATQTGQP